MSHRRRYIGPYGSRIPALTQNLLKLRAMEMILIIFHSEELRRTIIDAVRATGHTRALLRNDPRLDILPKGANDEYLKARKWLVKWEVLTDVEARDIARWIEYRNAVAHEIHNLTADLSRETYVRDTAEFRDLKTARYEREALAKLKTYRQLVEDRAMAAGLITTLDDTFLQFQTAERTYEAEIRRLRPIIARQIHAHRQRNRELKAEYDSTPLGLVAERHPRHHLTRYQNGRLTPRGAEVLNLQFDGGRSDLLCALVMDVTLETVRRHRKKWTNLGGANRIAPEFASIPLRRSIAPYND